MCCGINSSSIFYNYVYGFRPIQLVTMLSFDGTVVGSYVCVPIRDHGLHSQSIS